jgi:hypothetical protein
MSVEVGQLVADMSSTAFREAFTLAGFIPMALIVEEKKKIYVRLYDVWVPDYIAWRYGNHYYYLILFYSNNTERISAHTPTIVN